MLLVDKINSLKGILKNFAEIAEEFDFLCSRTKTIYEPHKTCFNCSVLVEDCKKCKLRAPVTYCGVCGTLTVMPDGKCLSCFAEPGDSKILENLPTSLVYNINACKYEKVVEKALKESPEFLLCLEGDVLKGKFGDVKRVLEEMDAKSREGKEEEQQQDFDLVDRSNPEETKMEKYAGSLFLCKTR